MIAQLILGLLVACSLFAQTQVELTKQVKGELPPDKGGTGVSSCLENEGLVWQSGEFACSALASGPHAPTHQHGGADEVATAVPANDAIPKAGGGGKLAEGWMPASISQDMTWTGAHDFKQMNGVLVSTAFDWFQSPGGTLAIGPNTVSLAPCPSGVSGTNTNHYLYISGGAGSAEAVLITGGTCTSNAPSGTIEFSAANSQSGAWQIGSATAGIQEATNVLPSTGGSVYIPAGIHSLRQTFTVGNGTSSAESSVDNVEIFGAGGKATTPTESHFPARAATKLDWAGPSGGTMVRFAGPIGGVHMHDFMLDGQIVADIGLQAIHVYSSAFERLGFTATNVWAIETTTHPDGPFKVGSSDVTWRDIHIAGLPIDAGGLKVGPDDFGMVAHLDPARHNFINTEIWCNSNSTMSVGVMLQFADAISFFKLNVGACDESIRFDSPSTGSAAGRVAFPNKVVVYDAALPVTPTWDTAWQGTRNIFYGYLQEGIAVPALPDHPGVSGWTTSGQLVLRSSVNQTMVNLQANSPQTLDILNIDDGAGNSVFTVGPSGSLTVGDSLRIPNEEWLFGGNMSDTGNVNMWKVTQFDTMETGVATIVNKESNSSLEWGNSAASNSPQIDFHSSGNNIDFDARIGVSGGSAAVGEGDVTVVGHEFISNAALVLRDKGTKPSCGPIHQFKIWVDQALAGVKDTVEVCAKDASDIYAWRTIY